MKKVRLYFIAAALIFTAYACDDDKAETNVPAEIDKEFMLAASDGGLFEVNAGQVASSKGTTSAIKDYGQRMLDDHTDMNQELMTLAKDANVNLPTTLSKEKQQKLDSLSQLSKMTFDTTYLKMMVISHDEAVKMYEIQAATGRNPALKSFASDKLSRLKEHLEMARSMRDSIQ